MISVFSVVRNGRSRGPAVFAARPNDRHNAWTPVILQQLDEQGAAGMESIHCTFKGTLTDDAALHWTERGDPELTFALVLPVAERHASPITVVQVAVYGTEAEALDGMLLKGDEVQVEGRLRLGGCQFVRGVAECQISVVAWKASVATGPIVVRRRIPLND